MLRNSLLGITAVLALYIVGCGAQPGKSVVKYESGNPPHMTEATEAGTYALYSRTSTNPDVSYQLQKGDKIGFVEENGKIFAVAGSHKDELKVGVFTAYYWKDQGK